MPSAAPAFAPKPCPAPAARRYLASSICASTTVTFVSRCTRPLLPTHNPRALPRHLCTSPLASHTSAICPPHTTHMEECMHPAPCSSPVYRSSPATTREPSPLEPISLPTWDRCCPSRPATTTPLRHHRPPLPYYPHPRRLLLHSQGQLGSIHSLTYALSPRCSVPIALGRRPLLCPERVSAAAPAFPLATPPSLP